MKITPLILLAAGAGLYYFRGKKDLVNELSLNLESLSINGAKTRASLFLNLYFDIRLKLNNPTTSTLKVNKIFVEIYANDKIIGAVTKTDDFTIAANSSIAVNISAKINTLSISAQIMNIFKDGQIPPLGAAGYVDTSFGRIPFKKKFE